VLGQQNLLEESLGSEPAAVCCEKRELAEQHGGKGWGEQGLISVHEEQQFQPA